MLTPAQLANAVSIYKFLNTLTPNEFALFQANQAVGTVPSQYEATPTELGVAVSLFSKQASQRALAPA